MKEKCEGFFGGNWFFMAFDERGFLLSSRSCCFCFWGTHYQDIIRYTTKTIQVFVCRTLYWTVQHGCATSRKALGLLASCQSCVPSRLPKESTGNELFGMAYSPTHTQKPLFCCFGVFFWNGVRPSNTCPWRKDIRFFFVFFFHNLGLFKHNKN